MSRKEGIKLSGAREELAGAINLFYIPRIKSCFYSFFSPSSTDMFIALLAGE